MILVIGDHGWCCKYPSRTTVALFLAAGGTGRLRPDGSSVISRGDLRGIGFWERYYETGGATCYWVKVTGRVPYACNDMYTIRTWVLVVFLSNVEIYPSPGSMKPGIQLL